MPPVTPRTRQCALPRPLQLAAQRLMDRASPRLRALSRGARDVLWEFIRLLCLRRPGEAVVLPLEAIAAELELSVRQVERLVAELVAAGLILRHQDTAGRPDPFDDAKTWLTGEALTDLGLCPTKMSAPQEKAEESKSNVPPVNKPRLWIPPGTEALHEAVGDDAFLGLLRAASRHGVKLQNLMARAGERVLAATQSIAGYVHSLLKSGGDWTAPIKADATPVAAGPGRGGEGVMGSAYVSEEKAHHAVAVFGVGARQRADAIRARLRAGRAQILES